jgi:hypothetical protein
MLSFGRVGVVLVIGCVVLCGSFMWCVDCAWSCGVGSVLVGCSWCDVEQISVDGLGGVQVGQNSGRMCPCGQAEVVMLVVALSWTAGVVRCRRGVVCGVVWPVV